MKRLLGLLTIALCLPTLVVLDAPILAQNTGFEMTVLANGAPTTGAP